MVLDASDFFQERESHYARFLGPLTEPVVHSMDLKVPHIDVYQFRPNDERPFWTLITGGMSNFPQPSVPDGIPPRAEIMLYASEPESWMFNVLKGLAEMPFDEDTFLHWGHTVPNGIPMTAKPSLLANYLFIEPCMESKDFDRLVIDGDEVSILWMVPITDAELSYKLDHGANALLKLFAEHDLSQVIDESRPSAC
jgi:Suppressor of fused protein (SUFU)